MTALRLYAMLLFVTISNAQGPRTTPSLKIEPDGFGDSSKRVLPWRLKNIKPLSKYMELHRREDSESSHLSRQGGLSGIPYYGMNPPIGSSFGLPFGSPYGSPYGSNGQGSPYGSSGQGSPYGSGGQGSPFGGAGQGSPFGSTGQGSPFGVTGQGSPFGSTGQGSPFGGSGQASPYGSSPLGASHGSHPQGSYGAQFAGGYSTGNMYGQYSSTSNPYGQRTRITRATADIETELNNPDQIQAVPAGPIPLVNNYAANNNDEIIRRQIASSTYSGLFRPSPTKVTGAYPRPAQYGINDWSNTYQPKQKPQHPVAAVANFEEYICAIYNKNLLTTWRMLSQLIAGHTMDSPGKDVLTNLIKLIRIYLLLHNGNASDEEKEMNLRESGNILMEASNPARNRVPSQRQPNPKKPIMTGFSSEISEVPADDNTVGLDVVFPVPKNKCQESALDSLVDTFKKLYIQYLTHVDKCDVGHLARPIGL